MALTNRELKWEKDREDDNEYLYYELLDRRDELYYAIYNEFVSAYKYYQYRLNRLLYKQYNCYLDYKLLYILTLPSGIIDIIFKYVYLWISNSLSIPSLITI